MFISPPRTYVFRLPRLVLFLFPLIGALISPPSQGADPLPSLDKLSAIPPGMEAIEHSQSEYVKSSKELEGYFAYLTKNAGDCRIGAARTGAVIAKLLEKSAAAQAHQRKKIVDALDLAKLELQTEISNLDGIIAEMKQMTAGASVVEASKGIIAKGVEKPITVISAEQKKIKIHNDRMENSIAGVAAALDGESQKCKAAYSIYFDKMRPLALKMPEKLKSVEASLSGHKEAIDVWSSPLGRSRTPASAQNNH